MEKKNKLSIKDYFILAQKTSRLNNAYLLIGDNGTAYRTALDIAKIVNCPLSEHFCGNCPVCTDIDSLKSPDVLVISEKTIKIEMIKQARQFLRLKNFALKKKILIIDDAAFLNQEAANAFLKTLEEPPRNSLLLLITSRLDKVIPTINSRCKKIYLPCSSEEKAYTAASNNEAYVFSSSGLLKRQYLNDNSFINRKEVIEKIIAQKNITYKDRHDFELKVSLLLLFFRDYLVLLTNGKNELLLDEGNYAIIRSLNYSFSAVEGILNVLLKLHDNLENINLNLAANILKAVL